MRLYPHPPVLIRRAKVADELPGNYKVNPGQDIMISVYNIHHSSEVWERAEEFIPERFGLDGPVPNETNTDYKSIPFSGGSRKCVGDQFAMMEAIVALAFFLQNMDFELVPNQKINMTTGATIHTTNVVFSHQSFYGIFGRKMFYESYLNILLFSWKPESQNVSLFPRAETKRLWVFAGFVHES